MAVGNTAQRVIKGGDGGFERWLAAVDYWRTILDCSHECDIKLQLLAGGALFAHLRKYERSC